MCGVCGRSISENLYTIRDLLEYVDRENLPLALLSFDQEKAFDRVDWGFLHRILKTFNFGPDCMNWVKLFYTDVESAIVIKGWTSSFFRVDTKGLDISLVRQGCPLSPLALGGSIQMLRLCLRYYRSRDQRLSNRGNVQRLFYIRTCLWCSTKSRKVERNVGWFVEGSPRYPLWVAVGQTTATARSDLQRWRLQHTNMGTSSQ